MPTTTFTTVDGMMLHETRGGVELFYVPDPLGSLIQAKNTSGTVTYEATYWPYGEVRTETGTNPSSWGFVGLLGYLRDLVDLLYVRARYYRPKAGQWMTVDPLWPGQASFRYVYSIPTAWLDLSGRVPAKWTLTDDYLFQYGNYCGSRNADPTKTRVAIDCVDKCCFTHDLSCEAFPYASPEGAAGHCELFNCALRCMMYGCVFDSKSFFEIRDCINAANAIRLAFMFICVGTALVSPFTAPPSVTDSPGPVPSSDISPPPLPVGFGGIRSGGVIRYE
jgi:RHS repeat-associated protein